MATISRISALFLMVALFDRPSDAHRTLGVSRDTPIEKAREHKKWLLKWLHPDHNPNPGMAAATTRVLDAWREVAAGTTAATDTTGLQWLEEPQGPMTTLQRLGRTRRLAA